MNPGHSGRHHQPSIYLAGPMVFERCPEQVFAVMRDICARHGVTGVSPLDNQAGLEGRPPGEDLVREIVRADIALMQRLDGGVFCLDSFRRGPEMDPGTAFEIGYMCALGKPLSGWTRDPRTYPARVEAFFRDVFGEALHHTEAGELGGTSGSLRDPDGWLVHSEGCFQNAMTQVGIELGGGRIHADPDWKIAFNAAVADLAQRLPSGRSRTRRAFG